LVRRHFFASFAFLFCDVENLETRLVLKVLFFCLLHDFLTHFGSLRVSLLLERLLLGVLASLLSKRFFLLCFTEEGLLRGWRGLLLLSLAYVSRQPEDLIVGVPGQLLNRRHVVFVLLGTRLARFFVHAGLAGSYCLIQSRLLLLQLLQLFLLQQSALALGTDALQLSLVLQLTILALLVLRLALGELVLLPLLPLRRQLHPLLLFLLLPLLLLLLSLPEHLILFLTGRLLCGFSPLLLLQLLSLAPRVSLIPLRS